MPPRSRVLMPEEAGDGCLRLKTPLRDDQRMTGEARCLRQRPEGIGQMY